jgi:isopenicillin-N N-acyltransferase-like protein
MLKTPIVKVKGNPYDCGLQHGSKAKKLIDYNLKFYERYFSDLLKIDWNDAKLKIKNSISLLEKFYPEILKEMEGIAAGSEKSLEELGFYAWFKGFLYISYDRTGRGAKNCYAY